MAGGIGKTPDFIFRPARRLIQALAPSTSIIATTGTAMEVVCVGGCARGIVRCKFSQAGTLVLNWIGPDTLFTVGQSGPATVVTTYTSNQPTSATLVGGTENFVTFSHNGEGWLQIVVNNTSGSAGTISYVDVACI